MLSLSLASQASNCLSNAAAAFSIVSLWTAIPAWRASTNAQKTRAVVRRPSDWQSHPPSAAWLATNPATTARHRSAN